MRVALSLFVLGALAIGVAYAAKVEVTGVAAGIWLSESAKSASADEHVHRATYPGTLGSGLTAQPNHHVYADFSVTTSTKDFQPAQVFVLLCKEAGKCGVFPAAPKSDKYDGKMTVKINLAASDVMEALYGAGDYDIAVVIGDAQLTKSFKWRVGQLTVKYVGEEAKDRHADPFAALPDIAHKFRPAESRPPSVVAYVFALASFVPLLALLGALAKLGPKISFPTEPLEALSSMVFQGAIGAILALYVVYWLFLNIFQAMTAVVVLGVVAVFAGNRSLKLLNRRRTAASAKGDKIE